MNYEDYERVPSENPANHMTAGAIAGAMEHCIMYPLDSVKTRMQSLHASNNTTISETFRHMVQKEGILRPLRGLSAVVVGAGPAHALYFATYEHCKFHFSHYSKRRYEYVGHGLAGGMASLVHDAVSNPTEVVKQRLQMANSPYRNVIDCITQVYRTEGFRAFYRSYGTQITMNVPFQAIHIVMYEYCQKKLNKKRTYDPKIHAVCGAVAGAMAAAFTTPLDVCKTLLNTQEKKARVRGLLEAGGKVMRTHGVLGFFKGMRARVLYQMPSAALCWSIYESMKFWLIDAPPAIESNLTVHSQSVESVPKDKVINLRLMLPQASVKAETVGEIEPIDENCNSDSQRAAKTVELPSVSGAKLYGALNLNTLHQTDPNKPTLRHTT